MNALTGMEKFSHLEDKIYLTVDYTKKLRDIKDQLQIENDGLKRRTTDVLAEKRVIEEKLAVALAERDIIHAKVEEMLKCLSTIDPEIQTAVGL